MNIGVKMNFNEMYDTVTKLVDEFVKSESKFAFPNEYIKVLMKLKAVQDDLSWAAYYEEVKDKETK
jgi:hypothetical protein